MSGAARLGDRTVGTCSVHGIDIGGTIVTASSDTFVNGIAVARLGDMVIADCGHDALVVTASPNTNANNCGVARLGDIVVGDKYTGNIVSASSDVVIN